MFTAIVELQPSVSCNIFQIVGPIYINIQCTNEQFLFIKDVRLVQSVQMCTAHKSFFVNDRYVARSLYGTAEGSSILPQGR